jgi:hypothetical protein
LSVYMASSCSGVFMVVFRHLAATAAIFAYVPLEGVLL